MPEILGRERKFNSCNFPPQKKSVLTVITPVFSSKTNYDCEKLTNSTEVFNTIAWGGVGGSMRLLVHLRVSL